MSVPAVEGLASPQPSFLPIPFQQGPATPCPVEMENNGLSSLHLSSLLFSLFPPSLWLFKHKEDPGWNAQYVTATPAGDMWHYSTALVHGHHSPWKGEEEEEKEEEVEKKYGGRREAQCWEHHRWSSETSGCLGFLHSNPFSPGCKIHLPKGQL